MAKMSWLLIAKEVYYSDKGDMIIHKPLTNFIINSHEEGNDFEIIFGIHEFELHTDTNAHITIGLLDNSQTVILGHTSVLLSKPNISDPKVAYMNYEGNLTLSDFKFPKNGSYFITFDITGSSSTFYFNVSTIGEHRNE